MVESLSVVPGVLIVTLPYTSESVCVPEALTSVPSARWSMDAMSPRVMLLCGRNEPSAKPVIRPACAAARA